MPLVFGKYSIDGRKTLSETGFSWSGIEFVSAIEDIRRQVQWHLKPGFHSIVVHLDGRMKSFESRVENGPFRTATPIDGDIWIVPAECNFSATALGNSVQYGELRFTPNALSQLLGSDYPAEAIKPQLEVRDEFIYHSIRKLSLAINRMDDLAIMFGKSVVATLCYYFFSNYTSRLTPTTKSDYSSFSTMTLSQLEQFINDELASRITLEKMAAIADLPPRGFLIAFRRAFGMTPIQYIISRRLTRAQQLLANTTADITEIALMTGFSHHAHLSRTFKQWIGLSPSDYRRKIKR
jgi:AraC family transcriptional regulator